MKPFNDFFSDHISIPEPYSNYGKWGEMCYRGIIEEGLTQSYPAEIVKKKLEDGELHVPGATVEYKYEMGDGSEALHVSAVPINRQIKEDDIVNRLNKKLAVYGWNVGSSHERTWAADYMLVLEPKFPVLLSPSEIREAPFYHVTHGKNVPKIEKIGLTPRSSQTTFTHPGGRIYILQTKDENEAWDVATMIAANKHKHLQKQDPIKYAKMSQHVGAYGVDEFSYEDSPNNMVVVELRISPTEKVYYDPMFPSENLRYNACFITHNVRPEDIVDIHYPD